MAMPGGGYRLNVGGPHDIVRIVALAHKGVQVPMFLEFASPRETGRRGPWLYQNAPTPCFSGLLPFPQVLDEALLALHLRAGGGAGGMAKPTSPAAQGG